MILHLTQAEGMFLLEHLMLSERLTPEDDLEDRAQLHTIGRALALSLGRNGTPVGVPVRTGAPAKGTASCTGTLQTSYSL